MKTVSTTWRLNCVKGSWPSNPPWCCRAKSNAMKSMWWQDIKVIPRRSKKGRQGRRRRLKGARGQSTLAKEKPPILGMIQRSGQVVMHMLANVQQVTIAPFLRAAIAPGTTVYTDEYDIDSRLKEWGLRAPHRQSRTWRVRSRRRWRRIPRSSRQYDGRLLVSVAIVAATPPRHFARETAAVRRFLSVRPQRTQTRKSIARIARRNPYRFTSPDRRLSLIQFLSLDKQQFFIEVARTLFCGPRRKYSFEFMSRGLRLDRDTFGNLTSQSTGAGRCWK